MYTVKDVSPGDIVIRSGKEWLVLDHVPPPYDKHAWDDLSYFIWVMDELGKTNGFKQVDEIISKAVKLKLEDYL